MSEPQGAPLAAAASPAAARPGGAKKTFVAKLAGAVADHSYMSLAIIVVLVVLVIGAYIYYHGLLFLGPYASPGKSGFRSAKGGKRKDPDAEGGDQGDPETERLIDSINSR
jgi:hypothetical protein